MMKHIIDSTLVELCGGIGDAPTVGGTNVWRLCDPQNPFVSSDPFLALN